MRTACGTFLAELFDTRIDGHVLKERHLAGEPEPNIHLEGAKTLGIVCLRATRGANPVVAEGHYREGGL